MQDSTTETATDGWSSSLSTKDDRGVDGKATDIRTALNPWTLSVGSMYVLPFIASRSNARQQAALRAHLPSDADRADFTGSGPGFVMLIRYTDSPVGPYDELLLVPGAFTPPSSSTPIAVEHHIQERYLQAHGLLASRRVTRIFVSSEASLRNGRRNWGIRKELADFTWTQQPSPSTWSSLTNVVVKDRLSGDVLCDVTLKSVNTWRIPVRMDWLQGLALPPLEERLIDDQGLPSPDNAWIQTVLGGTLRMQPASMVVAAPSFTTVHEDKFPNLHELNLWPGVHCSGIMTFTATKTQTFPPPKPCMPRDRLQ
ncbi:hypothetical protein DYB37_001068 [Aphanomyces astaci]|uniref:Uncharacterized protein n=1 Tax=Aphanomyces astaci TaxID=112090 RepID=A0A418EPN4_APHAT|nr:hypothetical protein DYB37_001068 [Aphanomyces astaci]